MKSQGINIDPQSMHNHMIYLLKRLLPIVLQNLILQILYLALAAFFIKTAFHQSGQKYIDLKRQKQPEKDMRNVLLVTNYQ